MAAFVVEGVAIFDTRVVPGPKRVLVANAEAGRLLAQTFGNHPAALILGHGTAVVGTSLQMAEDRSIYLELNSKIQAQAIALGEQITYIDQEAAHQASRNDYGQRAWATGYGEQKKGKVQ